MKKTPPKTGEARIRKGGSTDLVRLYLQEIGRVELLTNEEEVLLARLVQRRQSLLFQQKELASKNKIIDQLLTLEQLQQRESAHFCHWPTLQELANASNLSLIALKKKLNDGYEEWGKISGLNPNNLQKILRDGRRAKNQMIQANLRLVVAVAKKYQQRGLDLLDLVQEGTLSLERAVEKFDPKRGFRFSTYAYWWIRQGVTRAIATQSRTIRLPVHITEKLNRIKRVQQEIATKEGRLASISDLSNALGISQETVRQTLSRVPRSISLEAKISLSEDMQLGDLIKDESPTPEEKLTRNHLHADLEILLGELTNREAIILRKRFGLDDDNAMTLTQIGEELNISRERVRQLETRALLKLRQPEICSKVTEYIQDLDS